MQNQFAEPRRSTVVGPKPCLRCVLVTISDFGTLCCFNFLTNVFRAEWLVNFFELPVKREFSFIHFIIELMVCINRCLFLPCSCRWIRNDARTQWTRVLQTDWSLGDIQTKHSNRTSIGILFRAFSV